METKHTMEKNVGFTEVNIKEETENFISVPLLPIEEKQKQPGTLIKCKKCLETFLANQFEKHFKEAHEVPFGDKHIIENIISENPELVIKPEFVEIYSNENDEISCPPQIIINQAWSVNGVPSHFICIKNVKVTKDAIIIDVFCDIEKNEDAEACQKTQKVLDSRKIPKNKCPASDNGDPLSYNIKPKDENNIFPYNLKQEPIDDRYASKDFEERSVYSINHVDSITNNSNDLLFTHEKTQVKIKKSHDEGLNNITNKRVYKSVVPVLLQCGLCHQKFENESVLTLHMKSDHSKPHQRVLPSSKQDQSPDMIYFQCQKCDEKFEKGFQLINHLKKDHGGKPITTDKEIKCNICNKILSTPQSLRMHTQSIHEGRKDYQCDVCSKQFYESSSLNRHQKFVHEKVKRERTHICNFCGHMSLCNSALKQHIAVVHEGLKPYECKTCRKCFTNIYARTVHVQKVHEGGTKQICKICSKDCLRPKALRQHIRNVHENRKDYKCPQCFKDFSTKSNMNNHLKTVHGNT